MNAAIVAACITAGVSLALSVVAFWKSRSLAQLSARLEIDKTGYSHLLDRQMAELRAKLQQGLSSHEVRERMRADLRMRLFEADERRVVGVAENFRACQEIAPRLVFRTVEKNVDVVALTGDLTARLDGIYLLLPAELSEEAANLSGAIGSLIRVKPLEEMDALREAFDVLRHCQSKFVQKVSQRRERQVEALLDR